jgi:hypothetical protein
MAAATRCSSAFCGCSAIFSCTCSARGTRTKFSPASTASSTRSIFSFRKTTGFPRWQRKHCPFRRPPTQKLQATAMAALLTAVSKSQQTPLQSFRCVASPCWSHFQTLKAFPADQRPGQSFPEKSAAGVSAGQGAPRLGTRCHRCPACNC